MEILARLLAFALSHLAGLAVGQCERATACGPWAPGEPSLGRVEHFVLELTGEGPDALAAPPGAVGDGEAVGLALLRKRREGSRSVLELELRFAVPGQIDTRVHHVEAREGSSCKLVWREYRPGAGRTLFLEEQAGGARLRTVEWGAREGLRLELPRPDDGLFPLELVERARGARLFDGELALFEPLEQRFEPVLLRTEVEVAARSAVWAHRETRGGPGGPGRSAAAERLAAGSARALARTLEIRRRDGSLAGAYRFAGSDLVAFQWQAGGARARKIPAEEWRRLCERFDQVDGSERP